MTVGHHLVGPNGTPLVTDKVGAACVIDRGIPSTVAAGDDPVFIFRQHFTDDGLSTGSSDMLVDGTTPIEFWIPATVAADRYIASVSFAMAGDAADLSSFISAATGVLTNGVEMHYNTGSGVVVIHDGMVDNLDVIRLAGGNPAFGDGATVFQVAGLGPPPAKANGYLPVMDLRAIFGLKWGIRLRRGTRQKLVIKIQDDLTHVDNEEFDAIAYGFDRYPD